LPARVPPTALLQTGWLPFIFAFYIRVVELFRQVPGLTASSWWRDPESNRLAEGSEESQHLFALGMDLVASPAALREAIVAARGVGLIPVDFGGYVHVQLFPAGALARAGVRFPT